jgi:hypothetical protein
MTRTRDMLESIKVSDCTGINELYFDVNLIVLVKNKLLFIESPGWALVLDCMASHYTFKPLAVELRYFFEGSNNPKRIKANKFFQIGKFYRVKGSAIIWNNTHEEITLYDPEYEQVETNTLPKQFIKLLASYLTEEDLCFEYWGHDCMRLQYRITDFFPWLS